MKDFDTTAAPDMRQPLLGLQGPVVAWRDPWAGARSDEIMRTGTGAAIPSQDPPPSPEAFVEALLSLGAQFYVHHLVPSLEGQTQMIRDMRRAGLKLCLGNEYGNINGPYAEGTNRYDVPDDVVAAAADVLVGLLYDEPEHLQINASQYRKDAFLPHWGATDGLSLKDAAERVAQAVSARAAQVGRAMRRAGKDAASAPLVSEQVFPTMFHVHARGGMAVCPKVMKESFQPLQLSTALGAAKQYGSELWVCADLWGPDVGPWFTRLPGFPGHSPEEYASALRLAYLMGPTHLFTENVDVLLRFDGAGFRRTAFGDVWDEFVRGFVPAHPLSWTHRDAEADIVFLHADDSNYGQNARLFGRRSDEAPAETQSVFQVWHLLSRGAIPAHGSCMHIPGFDFPRHRLKAETPVAAFPLPRGREREGGRGVHPLFYPCRSVLVFDEFATEEMIGRPKLLVAAGTRMSPRALSAARRRAEAGADVVVARWLAPDVWSKSERFDSGGSWLVTDDFLGDERVRETIAPHLGPPGLWTQRFGGAEVRMAKRDAAGFELEFEIADVPS